MTVRLLLAPCCHDTIDLDPPDTEYLMIRVGMEISSPELQGVSKPLGIDGRKDTGLRDPYISTVYAEQPYHVTCLKAGRGMKEGVSYEQVSIPGPLGTRRLAKRSELNEEEAFS